jgi:hypothetical protein
MIGGGRLPCRAEMRRQIAAALCMAGWGLVTPSLLAAAQQKTAEDCLVEWRASQGANPAHPVTAEAYVARCPAGGAAIDGQLYSSIKDLMESIIDPSADALWGAVKTVVDQEGVHETFPRTREEWLEVRRAAVRIIEGANLLMMPGREAAPPGAKSEVPGVELEPAEMTALFRKDRKKFDAFAEELRFLGLEALKAADGKNAGALMDVGGRMQDACEGCHKAFWYPKKPP